MPETPDLVSDLMKYWFDDPQVPRMLAAFVNRDLDPSATAQQITSIYTKPPTTGNGESTYYSWFWNVLVTVARYCGRERSHAARMVEMLNHLSEQSDTKQDTSGIPQSTSLPSSSVGWRGLPGFPWAWRIYAFDNLTRPARPNAQPLLALTTFAATYLQHANPSLHAEAGMWSLAEVGLMQGLEHDQGELTELYLAAAATWMEIAAGRIRELCAGDYQRDDEAEGLLVGAAYNGPVLWTAGRGLSLVRWEFWGRRLEELGRGWDWVRS